MNFAQDLEGVNLAILNGALDVAERTWKNLRATTPVEFRILAHYKGIIAFQRGNIALAKQIFDTAIRNHGENVNLLRDLVVCQFHLRDMGGFRNNLQILEQRLHDFKDELCDRSVFECNLLVGKFLEEEARLSPALACFDLAYAHASNPQQKLRALIQKARWSALYEPDVGLSSLYRELISASPDQMTRDLHIELEHSLILIEVQLIGIDHAWQRVARIFDSVDELDQHLLIFDFAEGVLYLDHDLDPAVLKKIDAFKELDHFEKFVRRLAEGSLEGATKIQELTLLAAHVPWASYLRMLCLATNREPSLSVRQELNRKIQLIVRSLDPASQALWKQRLKQSLQAPEIRLEYSSRQRTLAVHGRRVDLNKKKIGLQLLSGLAIQTELSVDEAIRLLWQADFSPEHYHRLRMGVHRLNSLIHKVTGLGKVIEVDSQTVRLRPEVRLRLVDQEYPAETGGDLVI